QMTVCLRHLKSCHHTPVGGAVVAVMEHRDVPATAELAEKVEQRTGALGELEAQHHLVADVCGMTAHHMTSVQFGQFIIGQVEYRKTLFTQPRHQRFTRVAFRMRLYTDENVSL